MRLKQTMKRKMFLINEESCVTVVVVRLTHCNPLVNQITNTKLDGDALEFNL